MLMDWLIGRPESDIAVQYRLFKELLDDNDLPDAPTLGDMNHLRAVSGFPARIRNALLPWRTVLSALDGQP
jgi:NifU-like protein involved in Fe-S cluster formation